MCGCRRQERQLPDAPNLAMSPDLYRMKGSKSFGLSLLAIRSSNCSLKCPMSRA